MMVLPGGETMSRWDLVGGCVSSSLQACSRRGCWEYSFHPLSDSPLSWSEQLPSSIFFHHDFLPHHHRPQSGRKWWRTDPSDSVSQRKPSSFKLSHLRKPKGKRMRGKPACRSPLRLANDPFSKAMFCLWQITRTRDLSLSDQGGKICS